MSVESDRREAALEDVRWNSRAHIRFLNDAVQAEKDRIELVLARRFNGDVMVGSVTVELAREPGGWRVVTAWGRSFPEGPQPSDDREEVIAVLREGGIAVAH